MLQNPVRASIGIATPIPGDRENTISASPMHVAAVSMIFPGRRMRSATVAMIRVPSIEPAPCAALRSP